MSDYLSQAIALLASDETLTCVVSGPNGILSAHDRGIKPILSWLAAAPDTLHGAAIADKVVGKAAALLFIQGGISCLHTRIISQPALEILTAYQIPVTYNHLVERISNRAGDGLCPMESRVIDINDPAEAYAALQNFQPF